MKQTRIFLLLTSLILGGCAQQTGWTPTVDAYGDPNAYRLNQDMAECQRLAEQANGNTAGSTAIGAGTGGAIGAAGGAIIGAITGNPGAGALIGATTGGLSGGVSQGMQSNAQYRSTYSNCLRSRGHRPIN